MLDLVYSQECRWQCSSGTQLQSHSRPSGWKRGFRAFSLFFTLFLALLVFLSSQTAFSEVLYFHSLHPALSHLDDLSLTWWPTPQIAAAPRASSSLASLPARQQFFLLLQHLENLLDLLEHPWMFCEPSLVKWGLGLLCHGCHTNNVL